MEAIRSSETSVNTISTLRHIPEDDSLHSHRRENLKSYKSKGIPVTGRGGPKGCEMSRLLHFLDNQLTNGGEVISGVGRYLPPRQISGTHFC
jgi:hypothetical protein